MADTIAAIATAVSISAIGIIRVSGDAAIDIACRIFRAKNKTDLKTAKDRTLYLGDLLGENGDVIDICLCTVSRGPNSYTGEDTVEFQCHGSPVVLADGLRSLFSHGARQAGPGEFTKRAFLNGRMDLSQAEAVIDLIDAETSAAAQNAAAQLDGAIFRKISSIYDSLLDIMAHFHAVLDYPDEDIDDFKLLNDKYGHDFGDIVLQQLAENIKQSVRKTDYVFRWGGEEFLILLKNFDIKDSYFILDRMRIAIQDNKIYGLGHNVNLTVTIGLSKCLSSDIEKSIKKSDQNLYKGKASGKNIVVM